MSNKKRGTLLCFMLMMILVLTHSSFAQESDGNVRISFEQLGYGTQPMRGMFASRTIWLPFDTDWKISQDATVTIRYIASPLLNPTRAGVTVLANGELVTSMRPVADGTEHQFSFQIPAALMEGDGLLLQFDAFLRLTDLECEDANNPGQWISILPASEISILPEISRETPRLNALRQHLVQESLLRETPPLYIVIPETPDSATLASAEKLLARLVREVGDLDFEVIADPTSDQRDTGNLVYVGMLEDLNLPDEVIAELPASLEDGHFMSADGLPVPAEDGVLQILRSPYNSERNILLITGGNAEGLLKAASIFEQDTTYQILDGTFLFIRDRVTEPPALLPPAWTTGHTTFEQLGIASQNISGIGVFEPTFTLHYPAGWIVESGSQLTLHLSGSPSLDEDYSYADVFINGNFVGTVETGKNDNNQIVTFDLPHEAINYPASGTRSYQFELRLSIANSASLNICDYADPRLVWVTLHNDSYFTTPHSYTTLPDLQAFPYPFVDDRSSQPVAIVVPVATGPQQIEDGLRVAATLEYFAPLPSNPIELITAEQLSQAEYANHHLIILGTPDDQANLAAFLPENLPALSTYQALENSENAFLLERQSPWNEDRFVLLLYADSEAGVAKVVDSLYLQMPLVDEPGWMAVLGEDGQFRIVQRDDGL